MRHELNSNKNRDLLIRAGQALYGERWQTPLAQDLHTSDRTVRRWVSGQTDVPWGVIAELRGLLMSRGMVINNLIADLDR